ncbi:hypothetical protein [Chromatium okenii]|uniref:hypothetical protein n=1 Tax=Chromatium okenii TaxID=61644 RepID=UPI0019047B1A|nr:hypothetical protein [Chromatium okenii]
MDDAITHWKRSPIGMMRDWLEWKYGESAAILSKQIRVKCGDQDKMLFDPKRKQFASIDRWCSQLLRRQTRDFSQEIR